MKSIENVGVNKFQVMSSISRRLDELFRTQIPGIMKTLADDIILPVREGLGKAEAQINATIDELGGLKIAEPHTQSE